MKDKPYDDEIISKDTRIRVFKQDSKSDDYIWHQDMQDRNIIILEAGQDWMFQFDNQLPFLINSNDRLFVPKMEYHRLIMGKGILKIMIEEGI